MHHSAHIVSAYRSGQPACRQAKAAVPGVALRSRGFTILEIAIVLAVIGLLAGGVMVGRELIYAASVRQVANQITKYQTSYNVFKIKYNCIPGNCSNATQFFGTTDENGNAVNNGGGIGMIAGPGNNGLNEQTGVWQHLANAGLIAGVYTGAFGSDAASFVAVGSGGNFPAVPNSPNAKQLFSVHYTHNNLNSYFGNLVGNILTIGVDLDYQWQWVPGAACAQNSDICPTLRFNSDIDSKIDDGNALTGLMRASWHGGALYINSDGTYNLSGDPDSITNHSFGILLD